jgi:HD-GYP domain-containing protein (c-di-GMP phosphodiesterase class II)
MEPWRQLGRSIKLRHLIFLLLLAPAIIPLATSTYLLTRHNREILETQEKSFLASSAETLSRELSDYLADIEADVQQLGRGLLLAPGPKRIEERLRQPWVERYFTAYILENSSWLRTLRVLDLEGAGPWLGAGGLGEEARQALDSSFERARSRRQPIFDFLRISATNEPTAVLSVPIVAATGQGSSEPEMVLQAIVRLEPLGRVFRHEAEGQVAIFLIDAQGDVLWSEGAAPTTVEEITSSNLVRDFVQRPLNLIAEYTMGIEGRNRRMLGQVSPVRETGWGVVVHKPAATAFAAVREMVFTAVLSTAILVGIALALAMLVANRFSAPIQRLAESTHQIAEGRFGRRVEVDWMGREIVDLARDFNRMSDHLQSHVERLKEAARANRDLFISSLRAFSAAIDAKDPYTRGHSERVASYCRIIAHYLGLSEELQERVWISGLLHDVGKIGVGDDILKKGGVLSDQEYAQMKLHPVIGEEILSPIEQLRETLPAVRWHHEAWNGKGYPDGLAGEDIPLIARIVAVADTFDAVTTTRPYQHAYTGNYGLETIKKLAGTRFDAKVVTAFLRACDEGAISRTGGRSESREAVSV